MIISSSDEAYYTVKLRLIVRRAGGWEAVVRGHNSLATSFSTLQRMFDRPLWSLSMQIENMKQQILAGKQVMVSDGQPRSQQEIRCSHDDQRLPNDFIS